MAKRDEAAGEETTTVETVSAPTSDGDTVQVAGSVRTTRAPAPGKVRWDNDKLDPNRRKSIRVDRSGKSNRVR